jgi:hypothetical protein
MHASSRAVDWGASLVVIVQVPGLLPGAWMGGRSNGPAASKAM